MRTGGEVRTAAQNKASFKPLIEVIGDITIAAVTNPVVRDYKQTLLSYLADRYKGKSKDKTLSQLLEKGCVCVSLETVRNIMGRVSPFFNWLVKQRGIERIKHSLALPLRESILHVQ